MNDAERLYEAAKRRLLEDRLLGESIRRVRGEAALDRIERDFQFWQNESVYPEAVNREIEACGK